MKSFQYKQGIALKALVMLALLIFLPSFGIVSANDDPLKGWPIATPETQGMQSHVLATMMAHIQEKSLHIDRIVIVRN